MTGRKILKAALSVEVGLKAFLAFFPSWTRRAVLPALPTMMPWPWPLPLVVGHAAAAPPSLTLPREDGGCHATTCRLCSQHSSTAVPFPTQRCPAVTHDDDGGVVPNGVDAARAHQKNSVQHPWCRVHCQRVLRPWSSDFLGGLVCWRASPWHRRVWCCCPCCWQGRRRRTCTAADGGARRVLEP
jgi:hypothetical protein